MYGITLVSLVGHASIAPEHLAYNDELHGATVTAGRGLTIRGPAVFGESGERDVGLGLVSSARSHRPWSRLVWVCIALCRAGTKATNE